MHRATGARIELLLLHPVTPVEVHSSMESSGPVSWECMIGNKKKWKDGEKLSLSLMDEKVTFSALLIDREKQIVEFSWSSDDDFATIVEAIGNLPLPPYLNRDAEDDDYERYQTVYAEAKGAVAAPTAGLHFTDKVLNQLEAKGIGREYVTLHVGAGTFQPVKTDDPRAHDMHVEQIRLSRKNVERMLNHQGKTYAVGTTSMRVLESMYWFGLEAIQNPNLPTDHVFFLGQNTPYQTPENEQVSVKESLEALIRHLNQHNLDAVAAETGIYILPGYKFKIVNGLFTNFHLPGTTLMLLVAAFIGDDWQKVYESALENDYRFLSYGDSSLLTGS